MKIARVHIICIFFLGTLTLSAEDHHNELTLAAGISNYHLQDHLLNPMIFSGTGFAADLYAYHYVNRSDLFFEGSFSHASLSADVINFRTDNYRGSGRIGYEYSLTGPSDSTSFSRFLIGCDLTSFYCKSDYRFFLQSFWALATSSWYWRNSLDLNAKAILTISGKSSVLIQVFLPVVSNISRPAFSTSGDYDYEANKRIVKPFGSTVFIPENFSFESRIGYYRQLSSGISLFGGYEFNYSGYERPDNIAMYSSNFMIGITLRLK